MKYSLLLLLLFPFTVLKAQTSCETTTSAVELDINQVRTTLLGSGDMWWDLNNARYEVPKNSGKNAIYAGGLWLGGIDNGGQLRIAAQTYRQSGNDFFPGPGNSFHCEAFDRHWKVNRTDILKQISNYNTYGSNIPLSEIPISIREWPGKGNLILVPGTGGTTYTSSSDPLAPFKDVNGNGWYDPEEGDYPDVPGDQAIWWIVNDYILPHSSTGGTPLNVDVHMLAYAYNYPGIVDHTTFYKYKIINQGQQTINDVHVGQWVDVDLGYAYDDYIGCDTSRDMGIGYNGDGVDGPGANSYGSNPPLIGVKFLRTPQDDWGERLGMTSFAYYNNDFSNRGNPTMPIEYYNYLTNKWKDGSLRTFGGNGYGTGAPTNFMYPDSPGSWGWSECDEGNIPGDRRFVMSSGPYTLYPGMIMELDFAVIWKQCNNQTACLADFNCLGIAADSVQAFFENPIVTTGIEEGHIKKGQVKIYPNPAKDILNIDCKECVSAKEIRIEISDISGRMMRVELFNGSSSYKINTAAIAPGIYIISITDENSVIAKEKVIFN